MLSLLFIVLSSMLIPSADCRSVKRSVYQSMDRSIDQSVYADYANQAWHVYISSMYDPENQWLRLQYNSKAPSNYWNAAVAYQSIMHYGNFNESSYQTDDQSSVSSKQSINQLIYQLIHTERSLNQSDWHLRNNYNDDCSWMIHGLTALYDRTKDNLSINQSIYDFMANKGNVSLIDDSLVLHAWIRESEDSTCCGNDKGGIWWDRSHSGKATASQAGATLAALRIAESGVKTMWTTEEWVDWAIVQYDFWRYHMVNSTTGQVCDSIGTDGNKHWRDSFTYNEGLMMGDCVHLYRATNDSRFISDASLYLTRLLSLAQNVKIDGREGLVLMDDRPSCSNDSSQFHQVAFQYMSEYYRLLTDLSEEQSLNHSITRSIDLPIDFQNEIDTLYQFLKDNADSIWFNARDAKTGTFNCNWASPFKGSNNEFALQGSMNAALSALSLFAALPVPMGWSGVPIINQSE